MIPYKNLWGFLVAFSVGIEGPLFPGMSFDQIRCSNFVDCEEVITDRYFLFGSQAETKLRA